MIEYELYDLQNDPREQTNLAGKKPQLSQEFFQIYQTFNQNIKLK